MPLPISHLFHELGLALRLYAVAASDPTTSRVEPADLLAHVVAAVDASTDEIRPEVLLAMAYIESRFDVRWVSRIEGTRRVIGRLGATTPPRRLRSHSSLYCGALQTRARDWSECLDQRDLGVAYHTAARELTAWLRDRRVAGDLSRALAGYGCGNHGVRTGRCNRYPGRVLWRARQLRGVHAGHARSRS